MKKKIFTFGAIAFIAVVALAAFGVWRQNAKPEEIRVLVISPLTGSGAALGQSARTGMELALREHQAGGSGKVTLVFQDSKTDPATAKRIFAARALHANRDVVVCQMSQVTRSLVPEADREGVLLLATTVGVPNIGGGSKNFLRINVMSDAIAPPLARFAARRNDRVAILYLNDDYGRSNRDLFTTAFTEAGGNVLLSEPFENDPAVARTLVEKVRATGAPACFIAGFGPTYPVLFTRFRELAPEIQLYADIGLANAPVFAAVGTAAEGVFLAATASDETPPVSPAARAIAAKFTATGAPGRPDYVFAFAYDAMTALVQALHEVPSGEPQAVRNFLLQQQFEGIAGSFHFDLATGDSVYAELPVYQVQSGKLIRQSNDR